VTSAASELARFAVNLTLDAIPTEVRERAKACIADTLACSVFGASLPWSKITTGYASYYGGAGPCTLFGVPGASTNAPSAAFSNGAAAHAFEQDSLRFPGSGVHPGATLVPALAAACQETGADGARALTAFVAGCEVLFRIGASSHHSSEKLGFHAPGLTGTYGAAVAAGLIYGLNADQLANAMGIAGSMSAGVLAFTKSDRGAMVKRLHIGRAAEAGVIAARLAGAGYEGPETILEGRFGFLDVYCRDGDAKLLTAGLGTDWETLKICIKRYPCHVTAQPSIQALRELMAEHGFTGKDVSALSLSCNEKIVSHHDIRAPGDVMTAQYSVPFCVALALHRDPDDPRSYNESALSDAAILRVCNLIDMRVATDLPSAWSARISLDLHDGRHFDALAKNFLGMPSQPLSDADQRRRFALLTAGNLDATHATDWYERLAKLDTQPSFPTDTAVEEVRA
jgi:2-methylcitrate dehydratase PrpD